MWAGLEPDVAVCPCGGSWKLQQNEAFPQHGQGQCFPGHCDAWPEHFQAIFSDEPWPEHFQAIFSDEPQGQARLKKLREGSWYDR
jgi:hypothetical protein